jgi:hypothetical protein
MTELVWFLRQHVLPDAFSLLPGGMNSSEARAMLFAIGYQESGFRYRKQVSGPAVGFWQFERMGGVAEILSSSDTANIIRPIAKTLLYAPTPDACYAGIQHNDVLAAVFARLLLYRDPQAMPAKTNPELGWIIYKRNWRPGKPHPDQWPANFKLGWQVVEA